MVLTLMMCWLWYLHGIVHVDWSGHKNARCNGSVFGSKPLAYHCNNGLLPQAFQIATKTRVGEIFASATEKWPAESFKNLCNGSNSSTKGLVLTVSKCVQVVGSPARLFRKNGSSMEPRTNRKGLSLGDKNNHFELSNSGSRKSLPGKLPLAG